MSGGDRWLLPDGVEEALPARAAMLESLRRRLLDLYGSWGYELVMPPLIDFLDSLLCGAGPDVSLQTFTLTDQLSGRAMGVRADMTPQIARIDARALKARGPQRLCYAGSVLHARPAGMTASRVPLQAGAEIFGCKGIEADIEVICLMLETLAIAGQQDIHLDVGHVGIYRALAAAALPDPHDEQLLFDIFQRKAVPELEEFLAEKVSDGVLRRQLRALVDLAGEATVLNRASAALQGAGESVQKALADLAAIGQAVQTRYPHVAVCFDLCELRGYRYHGGCVFAAYVAGRSLDVAKGGRYDDVGAVFGRARPATGFSVDVKVLADMAVDDVLAVTRGIYAPVDSDPALAAMVVQLRADGERVLCGLPGMDADMDELKCDRMLAHGKTGWVVLPR